MKVTSNNGMHKLESIDGDTFTGVLTVKIPKTAQVYKCVYDRDYNMHTLYQTFGKNGPKLYIKKNKN